MSYTIESGIPVPPRNGKYPWKKLEVGQSFFIKGKNYRQLNPAARSYGKRHKMAFRVVNTPKGVRCWRVA